VFVLFILMCCLVNLMLGSASAQWAVTAPIFVPMLMLLGYSPEVIQAAYRIGDSTTNIITPMMSYFGLILAFATRYDRRTRHRHADRHDAAVQHRLPDRLDAAVLPVGVRRSACRSARADVPIHDFLSCHEHQPRHGNALCSRIPAAKPPADGHFR
jgi:predicted histidine transporter YuiF (NhaC family)